MLLVFDGIFGRAVAEYVDKKARVQSIALPARLDDSFLAEISTPEFVVFVAARPLGGAAGVLDSHFWHLRRRWLNCEMTDLNLVVGPHILPPRSACYRCFKLRSYSHCGDEEAIEQMRQYEGIFRVERSREVEGFLPPVVSMAGELIVATWKGSGVPIGNVREIDFQNLNIQEGRVIGVHGCATCRPSSAAPCDRFSSKLHSVLAGL